MGDQADAMLAVTDLYGRTFAIWTLTTCVLSLICARDPREPAIYGELLPKSLNIYRKSLSLRSLQGSRQMFRALSRSKKCHALLRLPRATPARIMYGMKADADSMT